MEQKVLNVRGKRLNNEKPTKQAFEIESAGEAILIKNNEKRNARNILRELDFSVKRKKKRNKKRDYRGMAAFKLRKTISLRVLVGAFVHPCLG